ncbi:MAG: anti-sigma factor [Nocardioides sp.]|nr:anti-sigma factor [Nocardioides sp.]
MRHADPDELAGLVLDRDEAPAELVEHVAGCRDCADLADALASTLGLAHDFEPLVAPPADVRRNVLAAIAAEPRHPAGAPGDRAEVSSLAARRGRRVPWWTTLVAAAAALVVGLGLGTLLPQGGDEPAPDQVVMAADLAELDGPQQRGVAKAVSTGADDVLTLRVRADHLSGEGLLEVWLINLDGKRMVSLGFLASGESGDFDVPARLMDEGYRIVDISEEPDDGDPTHSGVSLARGELA